jgi:integrase
MLDGRGPRPILGTENTGRPTGGGEGRRASTHAELAGLEHDSAPFGGSGNDLLPALREILATYKDGSAATGPDDLVFATTTSRKFSQDNFRERVFERAVELANEQRVAVDLTPLPEELTPHKLRHTCCSLLFVCGYELPRVMAMLGHADSAVTLRTTGGSHRVAVETTTSHDGRHCPSSKSPP